MGLEGREKLLVLFVASNLLILSHYFRHDRLPKLKRVYWELEHFLNYFYYLITELQFTTISQNFRTIYSRLADTNNYYVAF